MSSVLALAVVFAATAARATDIDEIDRALPCRPTIACTADLVPPGTFEVETGVISRKLANDVRQIATPVLAKLTLADWVQAQVGDNGLTFLRGGARATYLDDVEVGAKLHFVDQTKSMPSISVAAYASVPTFHATGYLRTWDAIAIGYVTKDVGPVHADLNVGGTLFRIEERPLPQPFAALALSMPLVGPAAVMVEGYVFAPAEPAATEDGGLLFALALSPSPWLVFDVGGDVGAYPHTRAYSAFVGATVLFGRRARLPP